MAGTDNTQNDVYSEDKYGNIHISNIKATPHEAVNITRDIVDI